MNIALLVYLLFIVAPISNFIHEIGHMIGAKLAKADEITVYMGRGKSICSLAFQNIKIQFSRAFFISGLTISRRKKEYRSIEMIYMTFLGPFMNAVTVFIFYLLYHGQPSIFILIIILYNAWLCIMNIIPYKIGKQESDGYIIVKELVRKMYTSR